jgi:hypothetical protein
MRGALPGRSLARGLLALSAAVVASCAAMAQSADRQIVVTVHTIKPLDKYDELTPGDLFARMTVGGKTVATEILKQTTQPGVVIKPAWTLSVAVPQGKHAVKLELVDKDAAADDVIDINRLDNRRQLEFDVDTKTCSVTGFAETYKCKTRITRTGKEKKGAEVTFSVDVKK